MRIIVLAHPEREEVGIVVDDPVLRQCLVHVQHLAIVLPRVRGRVVIVLEVPAIKEIVVNEEKVSIIMKLIDSIYESSILDLSTQSNKNLIIEFDSIHFIGI